MTLWHKIDFSRLSAAILGERPRGGWRWRTLRAKGRKKLAVVSPRGRVYEFKLNRGAWLRRTTA